MRRKPHGYRTTCRRCGRPVWTSGGIIGGAALYERYGRICDECITPDEEHAILHGQAGDLIGRAGGAK